MAFFLLFEQSPLITVLILALITVSIFLFYRMKSKKPTKTSLYDEIGGEKSLDAFVDIFYGKYILKDVKLRPFFNETKMSQQKQHMKRFLTFAFGGPIKYYGKSLYKVHAKARSQGLNEEHFNLVVGHLKQTLKDLTISQHHIDDISKIIYSVKDDVLGTKQETNDGQIKNE